MAKILLTDDVRRFLEGKEFINVGTCDSLSRPNVAPKFIVGTKDNVIYLADYVFGMTYRNLKANPRVSLSTINMDTLVGYQINGVVQILESGAEYKKIFKEMESRQITFSVKRLIEGLHKERKYKNFEVTFPEKFCIFKVKIEEIVSIGTSGKIERQKF